MWLVITWFIIIITLFYCILIFLYYAWYSRLKPFVPRNDSAPLTRFSVVVPARNEESNIENCIRSILHNHYPVHLYEIIVADDFSEDNTVNIVRKLQADHPNIKLLRLSELVTERINSYKKKSIEAAIAQSSNEWVITTDADCLVTDEWLALLDRFIQTYHPVFVAAPVKYTDNRSFLSIFQCLDFVGLQGITAASVSAGFHSMCNGANLAYTKEAFHAVNGFRDVDNIASGDDMLLMHKIQKKFPGRIGYLFHKNATVSTQPMPDLRSFLNQRIRWASKATSYRDKRIFFVLLLVYIFNFFLLALPLLAIFRPVLFFYFGVVLLLKIYSELVFLFPVATFFGQQRLLWWFPLMQPFHIVYTVISGWLGKFGKYQWKGRLVR